LQPYPLTLSDLSHDSFKTIFKLHVLKVFLASASSHISLLVTRLLLNCSAALSNYMSVTYYTLITVNVPV